MPATDAPLKDVLKEAVILLGDGFLRLPTSPPAADSDPGALYVALLWLLARLLRQGRGEVLHEEALREALWVNAPIRLLPALERLRLAQFPEHTRAAVQARLAAIPLDRIGHDYERLLERTLVQGPEGLILRPILERRHRQGSYYTPEALTGPLLDATLDPLLEELALLPTGEAVARLLHLRVLDPTCGTGHLLIGAGRRMARWLMERQGGTYQEAFRAVSGCLCGVDIDPVALEFCALRFEAEIGDGDSLPGPTLRCGDALLGAPPDIHINFSLPTQALQADDNEDAALLRQWRADDRAARRLPLPPLPPRLQADLWCAAFLWPRTPGSHSPTTALARALASADPAEAAAAAAALRAVTGPLPLLHWHLEFPHPFDLILGNPPFLNQLERTTTLARPAARLLRARLPEKIRAYTNLSSALLCLSLGLLRPGGRLGMIQPQSLLAAQDSRAIRAHIAHIARLTWLWYSSGYLFRGAEVLVCAISLVRDPVPACYPLRRAHRADFLPLPDRQIARDDLADAPTWSPLLSDALGVPAFRMESRGTLARIATTHADFRDEYYGIAPAILDLQHADDRALPRLHTTGLIDPACSRWGERPIRYQKQLWQHPRLDPAALPPHLAPWLAARRQPKILVATQTRVIEAVADPLGIFLPITPVLTVLPAEGLLWKVAALLLSPPASAWAIQHYGAQALTAEAIRLSPSQLLTLPLPTGEAAWEAAAGLVQEAHGSTDRIGLLIRAGEQMVEAFGVEGGVWEWWRERLRG